MEEPNYCNREKSPLLGPWTSCNKLAQKQSKGMISFKKFHHYVNKQVFKQCTTKLWQFKYIMNWSEWMNEGSSRTNAFHSLLQGVYKLDVWRFHGSWQHCWREGYFSIQSPLLSSLLPPLNKSTYLFLPSKSCSHSFAATDAQHTAVPHHPCNGVPSGCLLKYNTDENL